MKLRAIGYCTKEEKLTIFYPSSVVVCIIRRNKQFKMSLSR